MIEKFNLRVYGLLLNEKQEVLVVDEFEFGMQFTKFPGGGLELGEGLIDGLKREWMEELGQQIEVIEHFYTTDFFQPSGFHPNQQLISIYYLVKTVTPFRVAISEKPFDFKTTEGEMLSFRWKKLDKYTHEQLTFPIDKLVVKKLAEKILHA
ncbi:MAG: NUDIX domain-containing protein [Bacteroidota bacterium]